MAKFAEPILHEILIITQENPCLKFKTHYSMNCNINGYLQYKVVFHSWNGMIEASDLVGMFSANKVSSVFRSVVMILF